MGRRRKVRALRKEIESVVCRKKGGGGKTQAKRNEWKRKRGLKWLQLRGFSSRPGSRKEFMKGKSFPSTARPPALRRGAGGFLNVAIFYEKTL